MKRKNFDERDYVLTEVGGKERKEVIDMMVQVFSCLISRGDDGTGFPIWGESKAKLMELAYVLAKLRIFIHHPTGKPATTKDIAEWLCRSLHCEVPRNIYQPAARMRQRQKSIVDYYAMLWRENRTTPAVSLLWARPIVFPKIQNYREAFDSPYFRALHKRRKMEERGN